MKYFTLFLLLISSAICHSQTPFARPGAHWCFTYGFVQATQYFEAYIPPQKVINGCPCSDFSNVGEGCLFVRNDTVYSVLQDSSEWFLYDYGAQAGDKWKLYAGFSSQNPQPYYIIDVDSVTTTNNLADSLRVIYTSIHDTAFWWDGPMVPIVEGIGTSNQFNPLPTFADLYVPGMLCYQDSSIGPVGLGWLNMEPLVTLDSCVCHVWMGTAEEEAENQGSISWKDGRFDVTLAATTDEAQFELLDMQGRLLLEETVKGHANIIPGNLAAGLYFTLLRHKGKAGSVKKFVIDHSIW